MTNDPKARDVTLNYAGGSLTMSRGALESLFGEDATVLTPVPDTKQVTVKSHPRVRVIGEPASNVTGFSYELTQWPTSQANNAAAGEVVLLSWDGSKGDWTGRVTGSMSALGIWLVDTSTKAVVFRTERGTKYGPFQKSA